MKNILVHLVLLVIGNAGNAQSDKKKLPPTPPPPKVEVVKFSPPKIVKDEKIKAQSVIIAKDKMADEFYKRNPSVSEISRKGNIITIKKKDGTTEKYDMNKKEENKGFTEKYGVSPIPPPPPPPPKKVS